MPSVKQDHNTRFQNRTQCTVAYSECVAEDHVARCDCKEEFHGNGSVACIPMGFEEKNNSEWDSGFTVKIEGKREWFQARATACWRAPTWTTTMPRTSVRSSEQGNLIFLVI